MRGEKRRVGSFPDDFPEKKRTIKIDDNGTLIHHRRLTSSMVFRRGGEGNNGAVEVMVHEATSRLSGVQWFSGVVVCDIRAIG